VRRKSPGKEGKKWQESLAEFFELPKELLLNLPRITLIGDIQMLLENYGGIIQYNDELLRLKVREGEVIVKGKNLIIKHFLADELLIEGKIFSVEYR
jgi:sporulation protein YqfC